MKAWKPLERLGAIIAAEREALPVPVYTYDDAGTESVTYMRAGNRYRIATEHINVVATLVGIDYGAKYPLTMTYVNEYGDHLKQVFSPDEILLVLEL